MGNLRHFSLILLILALSTVAYAHPGHGLSDLKAGLLHPLTGIDHLLMIFAVGLWAAQDKSRNVFYLPIIFMSALIGGATLSQVWPFLPLVEVGVSFSVVIVGLCLSFFLNPSTLFAGFIVGIMGILHGYSHGLELPGSASAATYGGGFLIMTGLLHLGGIAFGKVTYTRSFQYVRLAGGLIALSGVIFLILLA
jgi:urease accessory protein